MRPSMIKIEIKNEKDIFGPFLVDLQKDNLGVFSTSGRKGIQ
jgi:hypothetical protein